MFCLVSLGLFVTTPLISNDIVGAGATFPYPFYSKIFYEYGKQTGEKINYQAIGSGGGIRQITNKTVDFGATDGYLSDINMKKTEGYILHIPTCLGSVVLTYNLPGKPELNISQSVLTDIYLGKIKKWNNSRIQADNPHVSLPKINIVVVHRSDGSGTSFIFTDFLSKISDVWKTKHGVGKSLKWPAGLGGKGNAGVAGLVKQIPGSIGYVELAYTLQNQMPQAKIENQSGNFIKPTLAFIALAGDIDMPEDTRVSLTDTPAENGYPIAGFTWLLVYQEQNYAGRTFEDAQRLVSLLSWVINEGQVYADPLHYIPLSDGAKKKAVAVLASMTYNGNPIE
jgi:phosphate transport system substrate-binding protein